VAGPLRHAPGELLARGGAEPDATAAVTALYQASALSMIRLAHVMVGDRGIAEDIVQEAFSGLYRRWESLADPDRAPAYVRSSVLNGCRSVLRRNRPEVPSGAPADDWLADRASGSGEAAAIGEEERRAIMGALRRLPRRQREVLVLRFYLDMSEAQIAAQMGIAQGTVRSAAHRALATLGRMLEEPR
jgi:RNA polymerase sigma-70 factor (sigma-E family)